MKPILFSLALVSFVAVGCAPAAVNDPLKTPADEASAHNAKKSAANGDDLLTPSAPAEAKAELEARKPGDFVVYKFSGSFRKTPATLTERVFARKGDAITIDMTLEGVGDKRAIRVKMSDASGSRGEVLSVARLDGATETATSVDVYDAFLSATTLLADANDGTLGSEDVSVEVGGAPLAGKRTSYRVRVGKRSAVMSTIESPTFAWGDLGGEIKTKDGKLLYRAEIVEVGHAAPAAAKVADSDIEE